MEDQKKHFVQLSRAWYVDTARKPGIADDVDVVDYTPSGRMFEWSIEWIYLQLDRFGKKVASPRLNAFDEAWHLFTLQSEIIQALTENTTHVGENSRLTPDRFCEILIGLGFEDHTPTEAPRPRMTKNEKAIEHAVQIEREACAHLAELAEIVRTNGDDDGRATLKGAAQEIRERSE